MPDSPNNWYTLILKTPLESVSQSQHKEKFKMTEEEQQRKVKKDEEDEEE